MLFLMVCEILICRKQVIIDLVNLYFSVYIAMILFFVDCRLSGHLV